MSETSGQKRFVTRRKPDPAPPQGLRDIVRPSGVLNDQVVAERMVEMFRDRLRYAPSLEAYFVYDGKRWIPDDKNEAERAAVTVAQTFYRDGAKAETKNKKKELTEFARKFEGHHGKRSVLGSFRDHSEIVITPELFDQKPVFNLQNGEIDLLTGGFIQGHRPEDHLTKISPVAYNEMADCPTWLDFLDRVMGSDQELIRFLQKWCGYCLTTSVQEQCLVIFYGSGANGKTTFLNTILHLLGDYAMQLDTGLLLQRNNEAHPCGLARLKGVRLAVAQETDANQRMAEGLVKTLVGGDRIVARFMRGNFFEFYPTHKICLATNHRPVISGMDSGMWRRLRLVPFTQTIPPEDQDKNLLDKLKAEGEGILAWIIDGFRAWKEEGLETPEAVRMATEEYRSEMDTFTGFVTEKCIVGRDFSITSSELRRAYEIWADENGYKAFAGRQFGNKLKEIGCMPNRGTHGTRRWDGIRLREEWEKGDGEHDEPLLSVV